MVLELERPVEQEAAPLDAIDRAIFNSLRNAAQSGEQTSPDTDEPQTLDRKEASVHYSVVLNPEKKGGGIKEATIFVEHDDSQDEPASRFANSNAYTMYQHHEPIILAVAMHDNAALEAWYTNSDKGQQTGSFYHFSIFEAPFPTEAPMLPTGLGERAYVKDDQLIYERIMPDAASRATFPYRVDNDFPALVRGNNLMQPVLNDGEPVPPSQTAAYQTNDISIKYNASFTSKVKE